MRASALTTELSRHSRELRIIVASHTKLPLPSHKSTVCMRACVRACVRANACMSVAYHSMNRSYCFNRLPFSWHSALRYLSKAWQNRMVTTGLEQTLILHCTHTNRSLIYQGCIVINAYQDLGYPVAVHSVVIFYQMSMFIHVNAVCDSLIL